MRKMAHPFPLSALLLFLAVLITPSRASSQIPSGVASVALVAILHDSITVRYQSVPAMQLFTPGQVAPEEVLPIFLNWHVRPGQNVHIQSSRETEGETRSLLSTHGFVNVRQIARATHGFSFQPSSKIQALVPGSPMGSEEEPVGGGHLLIAVPLPTGADPYTIRISMAVL